VKEVGKREKKALLRMVKKNTIKEATVYQKTRLESWEGSQSKQRNKGSLLWGSEISTLPKMRKGEREVSGRKGDGKKNFYYSKGQKRLAQRNST